MSGLLSSISGVFWYSVVVSVICCCLLFDSDIMLCVVSGFRLNVVSVLCVVVWLLLCF